MTKRRRRTNRTIVIDLSKSKEHPVVEEVDLDKQEINPNAVRVSNSSIKTWRKCKREYYYKFILKLEKKRAPAPLYKGKIIHELLEARINGQDWRPLMEKYLKEFDGLLEEEKDLYGDLRKDLPIIMNGYERIYAEEDLQYYEKAGQRAEFHFSIPLDGKPLPETELVFQGKIDTIAKDSKERTWLMEHKTFKNLPDENFRFANQQAILYTWVMPQIGFPEATGVIWDYIRTKIPTEPQVLKSGKLSKAKKIDTTYDVYLQAILDNNEDPEEYQDILQQLKGNEINFYRRIHMPVRKAMVQPVVEDLIETAKEIKALHDVAKARSLDRHCTYCSFRSLCQAELQGLDTEFIMKAEYQPSTYHLNAEGEEEE